MKKIVFKLLVMGIIIFIVWLIFAFIQFKKVNQVIDGDRIIKQIEEIQQKVDVK